MATSSITWPTTLPAYVLDSDYQEVPADTSIETEMDTGLSKKRLRYTAGVPQLAVSYHMTRAQAEIFETFFLTTTASGVLPFNWTHPRTEASVVARIKKDSVKYAPDNNEVKVSFTVEILP